MRVKGSSEVLEYGRRKALDLLDDNRSLNEVGRLLGCAPSSIMRWRDARNKGGEDALKVRSAPGRPRKLADKQERALEQKRERLHIEYVPAYAPEFNPDEGARSQLKGLLANGRPDDLADLKDYLLCCLADIRSSRSKLRACVHESGLPFFDFGAALHMQIAINLNK